jgi:hypothetical protein
MGTSGVGCAGPQQCAFPATYGNLMLCEPCGGVGQACCGEQGFVNDGTFPCQQGEICGPGGACNTACGKVGEPCCYPHDYGSGDYVCAQGGTCNEARTCVAG